MADSAGYPLLLFGKPGSASKRDEKRAPVPSPVIHTVERQSKVFSPKFAALQASMESARLSLQGNLLGTDPELVIVFKTKGSVQNFHNAVKRITGLEWLSDSSVDGISPDEEVFDPHDPAKQFSGAIYLTASNQRALAQILRLWALFKNSQSLPRNFGAWEKLFLQLDDVRLWSPADRITENVRAYWQDMLEEGQTNIRFEVELTARSTTRTSGQSRTEIQTLVDELGGRVLRWCHIEAIGYHAALVETDANAIRILLSDELPAIAHCPRVWRFQPQAQMLGIDYPEPVASTPTVQLSEAPAPDLEPVVAVLDGPPQQNHALLAGRLKIEDPDGFAGDYPVKDRLHGTAMCSLVVWGELDANGSPQHPALPAPVYTRAIFEAGDTDLRGQREERFPHTHLMVDLIERAVRRIKERDGDTRATAPKVKVINLSIGNLHAPFDRELSPLARLLDWLSVQYNVLFVVSAGNHPKSLDLPLNGIAFADLNNADKTSLAWQSLARQASERRMLSPAESINALTVGALHHDTATNLPPGVVDHFPRGGTSPFSAVGFGFKGSIKPELYVPGGRALFRADVAPPSDIYRLKPPPASAQPLVGLRTACPGTDSPTGLSVGTSNSAALVTRQAALILDLLRSMRRAGNEATLVAIDSVYEAVLVKALLVHCARRQPSWERDLFPLDSTLGTNAKSEQKRHLARWFGHGQPDFRRALSCTEQRATAIGVGFVRDGEALEFRFPLPPCLRSQTIERRLTATLAWLSPVNPFDQRYRRAELWFEPPQDEIGVKRVEFDYHQVRKGTVQHEVLRGERAIPYTDGDSLVFKVNCKAGAGRLEGHVRFALCVSLEVAEDVNLPIYQEVAARIQIPSAVRVKT